MVSSSTSSRLEIAADAALPAGGAALADADAGLRVTTQTGDITHFVAQRGLTPLFRVSRIRRGLLASLQSAVLGQVRFDNVRSSGPQVFSDSGEEPDDGRNMLEEVAPE